MDGQESFNGFMFHNNKSTYKRINPIAHVNLLILINQRQLDFCFSNPAALPKLL